MQTKPKRNSVVTTQLVQGKLEFTVLNAGKLTFDPAKAHEAMRQRAELHGWTQRISDAAAMSRDEATGKPATPQDKMERMRALIEHYESGAEQWNRAGGGAGGQSIVVLAVQRVMNLAEYAMAEAHMVRYAEANPEKVGKDVKAYFAAMPKVNQAILDIQKERLVAPVLDADAEADALSAE